MFAYVFIIGLFCVAITQGYTPFNSCEEAPSPIELRVEGCTESPCLFVRGHDVNAEWDFNVVADTDDLKPIVTATVFGIDVDYPLPVQNACDSLINGDCPLDAGESITYQLKMPILSSYPQIPIHLEFSLVDSNNNVHVCFNLDARIVT